MNVATARFSGVSIPTSMTQRATFFLNILYVSLLKPKLRYVGYHFTVTVTNTTYFFLTGLAEFHRTCHMAPRPINRRKNLKSQPITGMSNRIPIMIVPVTKGQKKEDVNDSLKLPRSFLPIQSPTYTRLMYIIVM